MCNGIDHGKIDQEVRVIHGEYLTYATTEIMSHKMELSDTETVHESLKAFSMSLDCIRDIKRFVRITASEQVNRYHVLMGRQQGDYLPPDKCIGRYAVNKQNWLPVPGPGIGHLMARDSTNFPIPVSSHDIIVSGFVQKSKYHAGELKLFEDLCQGIACHMHPELVEIAEGRLHHRIPRAFETYDNVIEQQPCEFR